MINQKLRDYLMENYPDSVILDNASYDNSIIGIDSGEHIVYSKNKMIEEYMIDNECDYEEAIEWIEYNTERALPYMGEMRPIIITDEDLFEKI